MKIGVLSAMAKEHVQLTSLLTNTTTEHEGNYEFTIGTIRENTVILMACGMGKVNAAVGATTLIRRYAPDCLISSGCAGGMDDSLRLLDVVVSNECAYHDVSIPGYEVGQMQGLPPRFRSEQELVETALQTHPQTCPPSTKEVCLGRSESLTSSQPLPSSLPVREGSCCERVAKVVSGLICSGDQFISDHSQLRVIKDNFPDVLAVDMESAAIAQTCFLWQVPFMSVRVISDTPGIDDHLPQYFDFWETMANVSFGAIRQILMSLPTHFNLLPFE